MIPKSHFHPHSCEQVVPLRSPLVANTLLLQPPPSSNTVPSTVSCFQNTPSPNPRDTDLGICIEIENLFEAVLPASTSWRGSTPDTSYGRRPQHNFQPSTISPAANMTSNDASFTEPPTPETTPAVAEPAPPNTKHLKSDSDGSSTISVHDDTVTPKKRISYSSGRVFRPDPTEEEIENKTPEELRAQYPPDDARVMSPRRSSAETDEMHKNARIAIQRYVLTDLLCLLYQSYILTFSYQACAIPSVLSRRDCQPDRDCENGSRKTGAGQSRATELHWGSHTQHLQHFDEFWKGQEISGLPKAICELFLDSVVPCADSHSRRFVHDGLGGYLLV